jgi:hypothetical protein
VRVEGLEPFVLDLRKHQPPFYAAHLFSMGAVLPAWRKGGTGSMVIDWPAAAMANPGVGEAATGLQATSDSGLNLDMNKLLQPKSVPVAAAPAPRELGKDGEVTFETFLEIMQGIAREQVPPEKIDAYAEQFGVPEGTWNTVQLYWLRKLSRNIKLSIAYARAMAAVSVPPQA